MAGPDLSDKALFPRHRV